MMRFIAIAAAGGLARYVLLHDGWSESWAWYAGSPRSCRRWTDSRAVCALLSRTN